MDRKKDVAFSILLVVVAIVVFGLGLTRYDSGNLVTKIASIGLMLAAGLFFGIACLGLGRQSRLLKDERKQNP